jgi:hypothetical protein
MDALSAVAQIVHLSLLTLPSALSLPRVREPEDEHNHAEMTNDHESEDDEAREDREDGLRAGHRVVLPAHTASTRRPRHVLPTLRQAGATHGERARLLLALRRWQMKQRPPV